MQDEIIAKIKENKVIAIVRGIEVEKCLKVAGALYDGGVTFIEITFDQTSTNGFKETVEGIAAVAKNYAGKMYVGAGTVLTCEQVDLAKKAGAQYIITPTVNEEVIRYGKSLGLVMLPGAMTPTEVVTAYNAGADMVKIFPVGNLGSGYIKALKAPLKHIPLLAVGGVNEKNAAEFIKAGAVGLGIGGNLVNKAWIDNGEYEKITEVAKELVSNLA